MQDDRIDALLDDCLDQPATAWGERVEAACAEHPALAAELRRRFEKLIALGLLDPARVDDEEPGPERLGHYRLLRRLGGGGMGVVYEAHDEKLNRKVALKVIRGEQLFFAGSRQRFAREMQVASRIEHQNLCPIYEAGEIDGVPYLAMRLVEGRSLAALLDERRRERAAASRGSGSGSERGSLETLAMIEKVARALHAAHEAGLVHRDVKPGNILIDRSGEPVLVDFGLAREVDPGRTGLTRTGERVGTPAYMAPEQVSGRGAVDRRTDVYALGVTLYECVTLRCPFESTAREDLYRRILTEPPPDPRSSDRGIGSELCVVLGKALEKDPRNRFATADELAEELRRIRQHEPIRSRRPGVLLRAVRWCQRNRAAAGILAATLIGLAVSLWFLRESTLSSKQYRALALLGFASDVEEQNAELAFQYAREALRLHPDPVDPAIVAKIQEIMFQLRQHTVLGDRPANQVRFSPDGEFVVATQPGHAASLFGRHGDGWRELKLDDDRGWRATNQFYPPPAVFSPDSQELALRDLERKTVHRYDLRSGAPRAFESLPPRPGLWSIRYHPDPKDRRFLVVYAKRTAVWDRDTGKKLMDLEVAPVSSPDEERELWVEAAFLPEDRIVAAGGVWSANGELHRALERSRGGWIGRVLVANEHFLTVSEENHIRTFDFDGKLEKQRELSFRDESDGTFTLELDVTRTRLLATTGTGRIRLLDADSLGDVKEWDAGGSKVEAHFSPDGQRIAADDGHGTIRVWDRDGFQLDAFAGQVSGGSVDWSPDGDELVSAGDGGARVWNFEVRRGVSAFARLGKPDVAVSPSGDEVVFTSDAKAHLYLCDASGKLLRKQAADLGTAHVRFVRDGLVAVGSELRRDFFTWDVSEAPDGARLRELKPPRALSAGPPAMLADGRWLLLCGRMARTWSPTDTEDRPALDFHEPCLHAAVSHDGEQVVFATFTEQGGMRLRTIAGKGGRWHRVEAGFVAFSKDARHVLAAHGTNAYLWDVDAPERPVTVFSGHQARLMCAVFSIDETCIATASQDGSIRIWDRALPRTIRRLRHEGVRRIAFTSSGQLVSAGSDGTVRWWWLDAVPLQEAVKQIDIAELTEAEEERVSHLLGR